MLFLSNILSIEEGNTYMLSLYREAIFFKTHEQGACDMPRSISKVITNIIGAEHETKIRQTTFDEVEAGGIRKPEYMYRISASFYCFTVVLALAILFSSCSGKGLDKDASIESWTASHAGDADFIPRARALIDGVEAVSPLQLESFVRRMAETLCKQGKEQLAASVAAYLHGIDLPGDGNSQIGQRLLTRLRLPGNPAPALPVPDRDSLRARGLVVLFFESDCHSCHGIIDELTAAYDSLATAGVRIVSIASDSDPGTYRAFAARLPWKDKYCDYESFSGRYFTCWGVAYTPSIYYVDREGIVRGAYHSLREIKAAGTQEETHKHKGDER